MDSTEMNALSTLLAEDDFAKGVALGLSAEKAEALNHLRAATVAGRALFQQRHRKRLSVRGFL